MILQNTPAEVNLLPIILPSLIIGVFTILVQLLIAFWFSKVTANYQQKISEKIEDYKKELNKELETHKIQLQSEFQTQLYEFQTRYSLFHQKQADVLARLYEALIDLERIVNNFQHLFNVDVRKETVDQTREKLYEYIDTYEKNRIYLDDDLCVEIEEIKHSVSRILGKYIQSNNFRMDKDSTFPKLDEYKRKAFEEEEEAYENFRIEFPKLRDKLRNRFRKILSSEKLDVFEKI